MSQSGRSSSSKSSQSGGGASATPQDTHKFSSIVNKVESLISKMHHDKVNNFKLLQQQQQQGELQPGQPVETATKCASLDSLNNLTDADSCEEHELLYTDSDDAEIAHITGTTAAQVHHNQQQQQLQQLQLHRRSDLDQLTNESIRELNEQCCMSLGAELNAAGDASGAAGGGGAADVGGTEQDYDNAWSVEEDIVYKCCSGTASTITSASGSASGSLCEECCFEEQLSYKLRLNQRDNNNNNNSSQNQQEEEALLDAASAVNLPLPICGTIAGLPGPSLSLLGGNKTRRVSNASSGSVSRMETILEEPTESKISVKEILARFETMNSNEVRTMPGHKDIYGEM